MDPESHAFLTTLLGIRGAGQFCAQGSLPFVPPGIVLKNGDDLALPLSAAQAAELRALSEPAPYGRGEETRLDESVRKCWQLDAGELGWSSLIWQDTLKTLVIKIAEELGVEGRVKAEPYKLLLYEEGGFFLPHRDTEKVPGMFGSLILSLPSRHSGGVLVVRHQKQEVRVDFGSEFDPAVLRWAAFFADCEHEVLPVTSGRRLCLVFNLILDRVDRAMPHAPTGGGDVLLPGLEHLRKTRGDDITAILLEHRYTKEGLSVAALKGDDRARVTALFAAAEQAGMSARLALVCLHQVGQLDGYEEDDYHYHRGPRRGRGEVDGVMGEIYEENLTIAHWRTPDDAIETLGCFDIQRENILSLTALDADEPDEQFAEGYTGNAGCTMEHWYRRAAVAVWPEEAGPALLARYDFGAANESFAALASKCHAKAVALGATLLEEAKRRLNAADDWEAGQLGIQMRPLLRGIGRLGDEALFAKLAHPDLLVAFLLADCAAWAALLKTFGARALDFFLRHTPAGPVSRQRRSWFCALDAVLGHAPGLLPGLAELLPRLAAGNPLPALDHFTDSEPSSKPPHQAHLALAASCAVTRVADRKLLRDWLWRSGELPHLRAVLAPALLAQSHRSWFAKEHSLAPELRAAAIGALEAETKRVITPYADWRRPAPARSSSDPLIDGLLKFMADPAAARYEVRRAQVERLRVEDYAKRHALDLDLSTRHEGRPHTLVCAKNDQSYHRALKLRAEDEALLARLREAQ